MPVPLAAASEARVYLALAFVTISWGGSFLFIKVLVNAEMDPIGVSAARCALGALALAPMAWVLRDRFPRERRALLILLGLAVFDFAIPWTLIAFAQQYTTSATASIANSSLPLWTALFAALFIPGELLTRGTIAGVLLGFAGVVVLLAPDLGQIDAGLLKGIPVLLVATAMYGISAVIIRKELQAVHSLQVTFVLVAGASLLLVPIAFASGSYRGVDMGAGEWFSLLALGALGSGIAVVAYMWLIANAGAVRATVTTYMIPFVAVILGWLILSEPLGWSLFLGLALVLCGIALVQGIAQRVFRTKPRRVVPVEVQP